MRSLIFLTATRLLLPLLFLFSLFLLFRGHQHPGGGFVGGLAASAALALFLLAHGASALRRFLTFDPLYFIATGLLLALLSGLPSLFFHAPFLKGLWWKISLLNFHAELGTPLLFDLGVYFVVLGVLATILLAIADRS